MKTIFKMKPDTEPMKRSLLDLTTGDRAVVDSFTLPSAVAGHLMDLGFIPGTEITFVRKGPGGGPRVYRVDGAEVALRADLAERITIQNLPEAEC